MRYLLILPFIFIAPILNAQEAKIYKEVRTMLTYPFSEPDPVPEIGRIYPYFRFDGYSDTGIEEEWKMVILENEYIKVYVTPEVGGKIWGAIEKSTGNEFLYFNEVVKFRDIAMRGPWTSGGLEYNFGDIGHIPTASTPVDYITKENEDGSVSCIVGAIDLPSRTRWSVSINVYPGKSYVETVINWYNSTDLPVTYYHWMNAAAKADGNLEFIYPGNAFIGHAGEVGGYPVNNGREISWYDKNNFGSYKSYHVLNAYSNFFGGYWHDDDFGFGHYSAYDDKPGKKLWIWGLSDQGMIWEDLLTDRDGQYIEYQSGKLFNQAAGESTYSPFKHREFSPHDSDHMVDLWFPLKNTEGMVAATEYAVLNAIKNDGQLEIRLSALQALDHPLTVRSEGNDIFNEQVKLQPLGLFTRKISIPGNSHFEVQLGNKLLYYSSNPEDLYVDRPLQSTPDFNWNSAYGLYIKALEYEKQRQYMQAHEYYLKSLEIEPAFSPALNRLALSHYRRMEYDQSMDATLRSLSIDTYDPMANFIFGLLNEKEKKTANTKSGYGIASQDPAFRSAGLTALARVYLKEDNTYEVRRLCQEALSFNSRNVGALEMLALVNRMDRDSNELNRVLDQLNAVDPTNPMLAREKELISGQGLLSGLVTNELAEETYLELGIKYYNYGREQDALDVFLMIPEYPVALLWMAYLDAEQREVHLTELLELSPEMVFPYRTETLEVLNLMMQQNEHWKLKYYSALINWNKGRVDEAKQRFEACGDEPDFMPFYLAKAKLYSDDHEMVEASIKKAVDLDPDSWRANLQMAQLLFDEGNFKDVLEVSSKFLETNQAHRLIYAKALIATNTPEKAVELLLSYEMLPSEGARESRVIYHNACVEASLKFYDEGNLENAINYAEKALLWPRNLGVGKPYDVDERMENYLLARMYGEKKDKAKEKEYNDQVLNHSFQNLSPNGNLLFQLDVLRKENKEKEAESLLGNLLADYPESPQLVWVEKLFHEEPMNATEVSGHLQLVKKVYYTLN